MLIVLTASVVLVVVTILILYETLRLTSEHLADLPVRPRWRIIAVVLAAFAGHTAAVWVYAGAYWLLVLRFGLGAFSGVPIETFEDCLFVSVVAYSSLGYGDHVPIGHARLLTGVEALNGLLLIGWSASFTYLAMERYWPLHGRLRTQGALSFRQSVRRREAASLSRDAVPNGRDGCRPVHSGLAQPSAQGDEPACPLKRGPP